MRVNLLAFCLLQRFGRPLPDVLRERVMDPIGASKSWAVARLPHVLDRGGRTSACNRCRAAATGAAACSSARAITRASACWWRAAAAGATGRSCREAWVEDMLTPSPTNASYGYLWWLNQGPARRPSAPATSVFAVGAGNNMIWIDPDHDLVTVLRWIDGAAVGGFMGRLMAAVG